MFSLESFELEQCFIYLVREVVTHSDCSRNVYWILSDFQTSTETLGCLATETTNTRAFSQTTHGSSTTVR